MVPTGHVFGYGSLAAHGRARPARLRGFRRVWNVAMDNSEDVPGYKHYRLPDGSRPGVFVAYLNLMAERASSVNGVLLADDEAQLAALDHRERNYLRRDVSDAVDGGAAGPVWSYIGSAAGEGRFRAGLRAGRVVVSRAYLDGVHAAFAALGPGALAEFERSTAPHNCPLLELERIDSAPADAIRG